MPAPKKAKPVTIVIPVYADWPSLSDCLDSLIEFSDPKRHQVIIVNDCGPEADQLETDIKSKINGQPNFEYYRNAKNLGFVKTCNRAVLELDKTANDILLLNSDTKITAGALAEISSLLHSQSKLAAVSPRTNNASIFTLPLAAISERGIVAEEAYRLFQKYHTKFPRSSEVPTAHGFCMLIKRAAIKQLGLFDEIFGRGYGEEVDFCQRAIKAGWTCAAAHQAFVFHLEARSFSLEEKAKKIAEATKIIHKRYPGYSERVRDYIAEANQLEARIFGQSLLKRQYKKWRSLASRAKRRLI